MDNTETPYTFQKEKLDKNTAIEVSTGYKWNQVFGVTVRALDPAGKPIHEPAIYVQFENAAGPGVCG